MNENIIEKLEELENNPAFIEKTAAVGSVDEMLAVLTEFGIQLAEDDLKDLLVDNTVVFEDGELSEDALDNISGGVSFFWYKVHLINAQIWAEHYAEAQARKKASRWQKK